jgi:hypothetical protein
MSRLTLPCPIRGEIENAGFSGLRVVVTYLSSEGCEQSGLRTGQLPTHIHSFHSELLGSDITKPSNLTMLKPGYTPFPPHLEIPPPLPFGGRSFLEIVPLPVRSGPHKRRRARSPSQSRGRKWSRLDAQDEEDSEPEAAELGDLPKFDRSEEAKKTAHSVICRRKPPESAASLLSQAHRMVEPPPPDDGPPTSIHFDTFARRVDELVANGLL